MRVFLVMLFLRFAVPLSLVANEALYVLFLQARYDESAQLMQDASHDLEEKSAELQAGASAGGEEEPGLLESFNRALSSTAETVNFSRRLEHLKERAAELIEHLIQLSVVFILQTGVLPLAFLWILINLLRRLLSFGAG